MKTKVFVILLSLFSFFIADAQEHPDLKIVRQNKTTSVKSQDRTNTCWAFTTISFIETEAIRQGKGEFDLSEMYIVYHTLVNKAFDYIRFHGLANFSAGGQAHDVTNVVKNFGLVPESVYNGINYNSSTHNHSQLEKDLSKFMNESVKNKKDKGMSWYTSYIHLLDSALGELPKSFDYEGVKCSPIIFNEKFIEFKPDDYIEFTSYSHHPFYESFDLEVPDNWSHDRYYNLPINEFIEVMNNALKNGYTIAWDGDISEKKFNQRNGIAELEDEDIEAVEEEGYQKYRQITFDNFTTTDDHLMHITGIAENKDGKIFYITKNSWGNYNAYGGYLFMSEDYVKIKTIAFMVHKDAVPEEIAKKIGIK